MVKDCLDYARRCKACQFHSNFIHQPPELLHPIVASWPFDAWGLDVVGPLPKPSGGHLYILVATDYFSKWAEVIALKEQRNSSMYNVAANGLAEAFNKTLCNLLKKVVSKSKRHWHDRMEEALWLLEGITDEENARLLLEELEALEEKRLEAQQSLECYQARLSRAFKKRVRPRSFQVGDQVLAVRRPIITSHKPVGKLTSKWDGPYVVQEAYSSGDYKLVDADGMRIDPINGKFLKKYYP
ncbi:uncharacterized protein [Nicotiana tomentosiformis]|uniref:uncharacterized protein n=1 Tax=Nicotiana tomentosiformis TaxID=4098 RepID=UPI00388C8B9B